MPIIDAQIHIWQESTAERPWPEGAVSLQGAPFSIEQALKVLDSAGVDRALLVPPSWVGIQNAYALEAAQRHPTRFAVMGRFDPLLPDGPARLKQTMNQKGMAGLRMMFNTPDGAALIDDPAAQWFWREAAQTGLPLMCFAPLQAPILGPLAERYPGLRIIIDHAGRNPRGEKDEAAWSDLDKLLVLARHQGIAVKLSSLPCFSSGSYPFKVLHEPIRRMYDAFGPQRLLWGSDVTRLTVPYEENLRLFTQGLGFLSADDRNLILGGSASQWCNWP